MSANQPVWVTGGINGMPVVRFNSTNSEYLWFYRPVQDDFTMIFVFQSRQGLGTGTDFWSGAGLVSGEVAGTVNDFGTSLNASGQVLAGTGNPDTTIHSSTGANNGTPHVVTFKRIRSSGLLWLYVDSVLVAIGYGGTQSLTSPNQLVLGAQQTLDNYLNGDIAEVQIYNAVLSDIDRQGLEYALKCKYGLSGGSAPSAPIGLTLAAGNRQVTLNWTMVSGATAYNLWRSTDSGASFQLVTTTPGSSYVDTNALNGQTNYYKLTASDACGAGYYSTVAAVLLPLPALNLGAGANGLAITWPGWASGWRLYETTNLTPPITWWVVTNAVASNQGVFNVPLSVGSGNQYFRLASP